MPVLSNGVFKSTQRFTTASWNGIPQPGITLRWGAYSSLYEQHLWVYVLVNKIANATARLPLKVYERGEAGRPEARNHPYSKLLTRPHPEIDPFLFWLWVSSTLNVYGEAFLYKIRDRAGRPMWLMPWHPTAVHDEVAEGGDRVWTLSRRDGRRFRVDRSDLVCFRTYNPMSLWRGLSPLEPLRGTLESEWAAREASSALWRNGARPSMILKHPATFKRDDTVRRIREQVAESHGGAANWAKPLVLEENMDAQIIQMSNKDLEYVDTRRLNREECCAAFDVPPPVVHILDRATFSNITEQMRSMYRDTMAPKLRLIESTLEVELRDGTFGEDREPDFGDEVYAEFLMEEVLRGDFEARAAAYSAGVNSGWLQPAEVRRRENLPFVDGSDTLLVNSTLVPVSGGRQGMSVRELAESLQKLYLSVGRVITADEAREILNREGAGLDAPFAGEPLPAAALRSVMGRLSRKASLGDVNAAVLTAGLGPEAEALVLRELVHASAAGESVDQFKSRLRALEEA